MRKAFYLILLLTLFNSGFGQNPPHHYYLKLSVGQASFGTGDIIGYGVLIEGSRNLITQPKPAINKLLAGIEIGHENGFAPSKTINPTYAEFFADRFYHISNTTVFVKLSYYPFGGIVKGFNIAIGPTLAYTAQSFEVASRAEPNPNGSIRYTVLDYEKGLLVGYRVSPGFEVALSKRLLTGARINFSSYNNGDINMLMALKVGVAL